MRERGDVVLAIVGVGSNKGGARRGQSFLTCLAAHHGHSSYRGTGDASHARPHTAQNPRKPPLTQPRSLQG